MTSLTTGILANTDLKSEFSNARKGNLRVLQVIINVEQLISRFQQKPSKTWDEEFDEIMMSLLTDKPCYIFYRLDSKNSLGQYQWLFLVYSPEECNTRDKMLYSSTRSNVKKEFGGENIKHEIFATKKCELTLDGYNNFLLALDSPNPLTEEEKIFADIQNESHIGTSDRSSHIRGLDFPIEMRFWDELEKFIRLKTNYIEISIDTVEEKILFESSGFVSVDELKKRFPASNPRYFLYKFKNSIEGVIETSDIFIFYSPGYKCSIKERMLYSSSISSLLSNIKEKGVLPVKRLELGIEDDLTDKIIRDEINPPKIAPKSSFAKPKPPIRSAHSDKAKPKISEGYTPEFGDFYNLS